jgi:hypothetical protein
MPDPKHKLHVFPTPFSPPDPIQRWANLIVSLLFPETPVQEPFNIILLLVAIGAAALCVSAKSPPSAALALVTIMAANDVATSATAECQGGTVSIEHYCRMNTLANGLRRLGNAATAFAGPTLFAVLPRLPFALFGGLTLAWAGVLVILFDARSRQVRRQFHRAGKEGEGSGTGLLSYWTERAFIEAEVEARSTEILRGGEAEIARSNRR